MTVNASTAIPGCVRYLWTKSVPVRTGQFLIGSITKADIYNASACHTAQAREPIQPIVTSDERLSP
jgi:hypothetical protein